jgi:hypothetical protein
MVMTLESYLFLAHSDTALLAIIIFLSFYRFQKAKSHIKLIGLLGFAGFASNMISLMFARMKWTNLINIPGSVYDFILLLIVTILFNNETNKKHRFYFITVASLYFVTAFINLIFIQKEEIASYTKLMGSMIIITYAIVYFYRLMIDLPTYEVHRLPMFWFSSSFLIYHAGTIFLFAFTSYLVHVLQDNLLIYYSFHHVLSIINHFIIIIGLVFHLKSTQQVITA